jgi:hypothetical protein
MVVPTQAPPSPNKDKDGSHMEWDNYYIGRDGNYMAGMVITWARMVIKWVIILLMKKIKWLQA